ncbi:MAG: hypothetical protein N3A58_01270 [Spirochaetes bacterium]|nr:hypothetical protein [Spirochaetota bacterium]
MKKIFILFIIVPLILTFFSCGLTQYKNQEETKIYNFNATKVKSVFDTTFDQMKAILNDPQNDHKYSEMGETDIIGVTCVEDDNYVRFDLYHKNPISLKYDVFYGFYDLLKEGSIEYRYYPSDGAFYAILYDAKGAYKEHIEIDLEKVDDYIKAWSIDEKYKNITIVTFILNKEKHFGNNKNQQLYLFFVSGFYDSKNKKIYFSDETDYVGLIINN